MARAFIQRHFRNGWEFAVENRAALRRVRYLHLSAVYAHDAQSDGQSQPGPNTHGFCGEKGIEDPGLDGLRYSWSGVGDFQQHTPLADSFCPHPDGSAPALLFEGLPRIDHQIHHHLLQLSGVALDKGKSRVQIRLHADLSRAETEALEFHGPLDDLIQGHRAALRDGYA